MRRFPPLSNMTTPMALIRQLSLFTSTSTSHRFGTPTSYRSLLLRMGSDYHLVFLPLCPAIFRRSSLFTYSFRHPLDLRQVKPAL